MRPNPFYPLPLPLPLRAAALTLSAFLAGCAARHSGLVDDSLRAHSIAYTAQGRTGILPGRTLSFGPYRTGPLERRSEEIPPDPGRAFPTLESRDEVLRFSLIGPSGDTIEALIRRAVRVQSAPAGATLTDAGPYRVSLSSLGRTLSVTLAPDSCSAVPLPTRTLQACPAVEVDRPRNLLFDGVYIRSDSGTLAAFHFNREDRLWLRQGLPPYEELWIAALYATYLARGTQPLENHRLKPKQVGK